MSATIYYFSATGNCLTTAKAIAEKLDDCRLVPVASTRYASKIIETADTVGFVCPVYYGDMPYPVREMIGKMVFEGEPYLFLIVTQRGQNEGIAPRIDHLLNCRGQRLSYFARVKMPGNSFINPPEVDARYLADQQKNIDLAMEGVLHRAVQDFSDPQVLPLRPVDYPNNFRGIAAIDGCVGCGVCRTVCPMDNICLEDGKAMIGEDCASCLACFHWCPQQAIVMTKQEGIERREKYHHPDVTLGEIAAQKLR